DHCKRFPQRTALLRGFPRQIMQLSFLGLRAMFAIFRTTQFLKLLIVSPGTKQIRSASCQVISIANSASWTHGCGQVALFVIAGLATSLAVGLVLLWYEKYQDASDRSH